MNEVDGVLLQPLLRLFEVLIDETPARVEEALSQLLVLMLTNSEYFWATRVCADALQRMGSKNPLVAAWLHAHQKEIEWLDTWLVSLFLSPFSPPSLPSPRCLLFSFFSLLFFLWFCFFFCFFFF